MSSFVLQVEQKKSGKLFKKNVCISEECSWQVQGHALSQHGACSEQNRVTAVWCLCGLCGVYNRGSHLLA